MGSDAPYRILLCLLLLLLLIVLGLAFSPQVAGATGVPHPEYGIKILIGPNNIDQEFHTRWLGYFFGLCIIGVFWTFLYIGARKKGKKTVMARVIGLCFALYILAYTLMSRSHWRYTEEGGSDFVFMMPEPTAWMIYAMWFIPIIITIGFVCFFERAVISDEEIASFHQYINSKKDD